MPPKKNSKISNENSYSKKPLGKPLLGKKKPSQSKSLYDSVTPNFGSVSQDSVNQGWSSKPQLDSIFEDSFDFSEIAEKNKTEQDSVGLVYEDQLDKIESSKHLKSTTQTMELINSQSRKNDKAIMILQTNFNLYRNDTENKLLYIQEEAAGIKNEITYADSYKNKICLNIDNQLWDIKNKLDTKFQEFVAKADCSEKVPKLATNVQYTIERMQKVRDEYDTKIKENEIYINQLKHKNMRSKSNSRCFELAEENQKLREEISILLDD
jgi:hypothetical protein